MPLLFALPGIGYAQPVQPPTRAEAEAALNPTPAGFSNAQLDQMLAPIALYPDQLLTEVLMAATFPDQLVDAGKWLQDGSNAALKNDDLANALQPLPWDPSVKSLVAFPQIIAMMTNHLDWTEALGTAFANQEVQTMARVQFLRERAMHAGQLKSTSQLAVREESSDIIIEPTDPNMIYVPVYNPAEVYGTWPDSDAPPVYIPPPRGFYNGALGAGIGFSVGLGVVAPLWGWGHPDWRRHEVVVDPGRYQHITTETAITHNHITVENQVWHRTGPVAIDPGGAAAAPAGTCRGEQPPGTVLPTIKPPARPPARARPGAAARGRAPAHPPSRNPAREPPTAASRPRAAPGGRTAAAPGRRAAGETPPRRRRAAYARRRSAPPPRRDRKPHPAEAHPEPHRRRQRRRIRPSRRRKTPANRRIPAAKPPPPAAASRRASAAPPPHRAAAAAEPPLAAAAASGMTPPAPHAHRRRHR